MVSNTASTLYPFCKTPASINVVHLSRLKGHVCQWDHSHYFFRIFELIKLFEVKGSLHSYSKPCIQFKMKNKFNPTHEVCKYFTINFS